MKIDWKKIFGIVVVYLWIVIISFLCFSIYQNIPVSKNIQNYYPTQVPQNNIASSTNLSLENDPNVKIEYSTSTVNFCGKNIKVYPTVYLKGIEIWSDLARISSFFPRTKLCENIKLNYPSGFIENKIEQDTNNKETYFLSQTGLIINTVDNSVWTNGLGGTEYLYPWSSEIEKYIDYNKIVEVKSIPMEVNFCGKKYTYNQTIKINGVDILKRIAEIANKMPTVIKINSPQIVNKDICTSIKESQTPDELNVKIEQGNGPWDLNIKINNRLLNILIPENTINEYGYEWYSTLGPLDKQKKCTSCNPESY